MKVAEIMTRKILKVRMEDSFGTIRDILENVAFHHLLVVENRKLVGIISTHDILRVLVSALETEPSTGHHYSGFEHKKVHQFMTRNPIVVQKDIQVNTAAQIMLKNKISCLPVLAPDGEIEGIMTMRDILSIMTVNK